MHPFLGIRNHLESLRFRLAGDDSISETLHTGRGSVHFFSLHLRQPGSEASYEDEGGEE